MDRLNECIVWPKRGIFQTYTIPHCFYNLFYQWIRERFAPYCFYDGYGNTTNSGDSDIVTQEIGTQTHGEASILEGQECRLQQEKVSVQESSHEIIEDVPLGKEVVIETVVPLSQSSSANTMDIDELPDASHITQSVIS